MSPLSLTGRFSAIVAIFLGPAPILRASPPVVQDSVGGEYRLIEANHFEMGAAAPESFRKDHVHFNVDDDRPIHPVILSKPFYMATTEVTVDQFRRFTDDSGYQTTAEKAATGMVVWDPVDDPDNGRVKSTFRTDTQSDWKNPGIPQQGSHPVVGVSFHDAKAYCDWLSKKEGARYRLPTEAEWECACRAGTNTPFSFGSRYQQTIHRYANVGNVELERASPGRVRLQWMIDPETDPGDGHVFTAPVGSYQPNRWGLFDLHGNVWEWCEDRYLDTFYKRFDRQGHRQVRKRAIDPLCTESWNEHGDWRVIRGGSWFVAPIQCRSGSRGMLEASDAACYVGFRVVREADDERVRQSQRRHQKSEAALQRLGSAARDVLEERDGHLHLEFSCRDLNEQVMQDLAALQYAVELQITPPGRLASDHIRQIAKMGHLTGWILSAGGDLSADDFAPLAKHPEIQRLQITGIPGLSDRLLNHFREAEGLISINLQGDQITDEGLMRFPKLQNLRTLHVASTRSQGLALSRFSGSSLRELSLARLTDEAAENLRGFPTVQSLNLRGSPITAAGLQHVASLRLLENLDLAGCSRLDDADFQPLSLLPHPRRIQLAETAAGDRAMAAIRGCNTLQGLSVGSRQLTDRGLKTICEMVSLREVTLSDQATEITDDGFADFWRLVNLETLTLQAPEITGRGLAPLTELPKLRRLNLSGRALSDAALGNVARMEHLEELFIGSWQEGGPTGLTDEGWLQLAKSSGLKKVTLIRSGTTVSVKRSPSFDRKNLN